MKHILCAILLSIGFMSVAFGLPCWDGPGGNSCGSAPACAPGQPPNGGPYTIPAVVGMPCAHIYCDNANVCYQNSSQKRMLITSRTLYVWQLCSGGTSQCVTSGTTETFSGCCLCSNPGVITYP